MLQPIVCHLDGVYHYHGPMEGVAPMQETDWIVSVGWKESTSPAREMESILLARGTESTSLAQGTEKTLGLENMQGVEQTSLV